MALQYVENTNSYSQDTDTIKNNGHTAGFVSGGSTATIERPTGGSVTQNGAPVASSAAGGVFTSTGGNAGTTGGSRTEQGGNRRDGSNGSFSGSVSESIAAGSQMSSYYSGGGGGLGAVLGNADAPNTTAINPQGLASGGSFNPLFLLVIPLVVLALRKK